MVLQCIGVPRLTHCGQHYIVDRVICQRSPWQRPLQTSKNSSAVVVAITHSSRQLALHALPLDLVAVPQVCFTQVSKGYISRNCNGMSLCKPANRASGYSSGSSDITYPVGVSSATAERNVQLVASIQQMYLLH